MKFLKSAGVVVVTLGLLVPVSGVVSANAVPNAAGGQGAQSANPDKGQGKGTCRREAKTEFKAALKAARDTKKAAYRAAKDDWLSATAEQRATREAALAIATTEVEVKAAKDAFKATTTEERAARQDAKRSARKGLFTIHGVPVV